MAVTAKFDVSWTGHALELPYDLDALEGAVAEAIWHFLMPDLLGRDVRNITVKLTEMGIPDHRGQMMGVRLGADGSIEVFDEHV